MIYSLVHYPAIDTKRINQLRRKYDPQVELIQPHITIMFPVPGSIGGDRLVNNENAYARALDEAKRLDLDYRGLSANCT